jgi:hypothetical protein
MHRTSFDHKFKCFDIVYLLHDPDQLPRQVVGVIYDSQRMVQYQLICGTQFTFHYEAEISKVRNSVDILGSN